MPACRAGAQAIVDALPSSWPSGGDAGQALLHAQPCGAGRPRPAWGACEGSSPELRGYTCGLWTLLHALAERVEPETGGAAWYFGARAFARSFFSCSDCSAHFLERTGEEDVASLGSGGPASSARQAALWAWRVHNEVNERLAVEEAAGGPGVDAAFPKETWPSHELCAACGCVDPAHCAHTWPHHGPGGGLWDEDEVASFLTRFYGPQPGEAVAERPGSHEVRSAAEGLGEMAHELAAEEAEARAREAHARTHEAHAARRSAAEEDAAAHEEDVARARAAEAARGGARTGARGADTQRAPAFSGRAAPGTGRAMDAHDIHKARTLSAPGGMPVWLFVALCAVTPVALYAALAGCGLVGGRKAAAQLLASAASNAAVKPSRFSPSWQIARMLGGKKKTGIGASLAALNGQSLKTV